MFLWAIYIFPGSIHLFCCSNIGRPILGIYKLLTDRWIGNKPAQIHFWNICFEFSVQCLSLGGHFHRFHNECLSKDLWSTRPPPPSCIVDLCLLYSVHPFGGGGTTVQWNAAESIGRVTFKMNRFCTVICDIHFLWMGGVGWGGGGGDSSRPLKVNRTISQNFPLPGCNWEPENGQVHENLCSLR